MTRVAVSVHELVGRLLLVDAGGLPALFVDRSSGGIVSADERVEVDSTALEPIPASLAPDDDRLAREFCATLDDAANRGRVELALASEDPGDAFATAVYRCKIASDWFRFRDERIAGAVRQWLDERRIPYVDQPALGDGDD